MKKLSIFAALLLVFGFTSCTDIDNATGNDVDDGKMTITLDDVMYKVDLVGTFAGEVGQEVSLKLGVYDAYDIYGVDFGDGVIHSDTVCYQNGGLLGDDGMTKPGTKHTSATEFKGTVAGDGIVKVYGNSDVWYANLSGGLVPTALSSEKLTKIVQLWISGAEVEELDLKDLAVLQQFSFTQGSVTSVNVADNPELTNLTINNNSASKFESKLASLDVSKNTKLTYLNVTGASAEKPGLLTTLDLSNNPKLTQFYAQYNKLTSVKFADGAKLTFLNVQNNELAEMDLSGVESVKDIYASDNKLTAIDLSKLTAKATLNLFNNELTELTVPVDAKTIDAKNNKIAKVAIKNVTSKLALENNKLTFSNLPTVPEALATKTNKYTYAPQDTVLAVKLDFQVLDLTGEYGPFQGITDAKDKKTAVTFKAGEVDVPAENYEAKDGKVTFFHVYDKINGVLTNEAFPGLTLTTKEFAIKTYGTDVEEAGDATVYALKEGDTFTSGQTVTVDGFGTITYGEAGEDNPDFKAAVAQGSVEGFTAYTAGNGINGNKAGGTFYILKPTKDFKVEVAVVLNSGKAFYIEEDGTALADYNGITTDEKYMGTFVFDAKAGKTYKVYCSGSKLGFYGFTFK